MLTNARGGGVVVTSGAEPQTVLDELSHEIERLNKENAALRQRIQLLTHRLFGRRSEKGVPVVEQGVLPFEPVVAGPVQPETTDESRRDDTAEGTRVRRRHPGRRRLPADLPRERIEIVPPASERHCATCGTAKVRIGADTTEELDYVPASFVIREYVRPKYACASCQQGVVQASLPARPIEKGRPGAGLLAHVVTSKYADHLPLYRQEQIFERHGVEVTRRTLSEWNGAVADMLEPIVRAMHREQVCQSPWIQCDDTTLDVQDPSRVPEIRTGHLWVYRGEGGEVVYDFTWARNRDGPLKMLAGYRGYLQVDAAPAYDDVFAQRPEIIEVGCWAHARRYFKEALPTAAVSCARVLATIGQLYGIERTANVRQLDASARQRLRQEQARPILERLRAYLQEQGVTALPKSPLGTAIGYGLRNWTALTCYTHDGRLRIDNNGAEQALRPIVLGRKNWLFAGSEAAAHRTAIMCSLVQTCKHLQIDPFVYLRDIIERVSTHPARLILELTPRGWKRRRQDRAAQAAA
jgi:transposase